MKDADFSRYRALASGLASPVLAESPAVTTPVVPGREPVAIGASAARLLIADDPSLHASLADGMRRLASLARMSGTNAPPILRAPGGQGRPVYFALVLHVHLAAFARHYESLPSSVWSVCEDAMADALAPARAIEAFADAAPPVSETHLYLWWSLCMMEQALLARRDVDAEVADSIVHRIVARPGPEGSLHPRDDRVDGDSLDLWTYRELAGLHALADLALLRRNTAWAKRVQEITDHHLRLTQPDNSTAEPWAFAAFAWSPRARTFADQQLHDATMHGSGGRVGLVAALLLADACATLRVLET